MRNDTAALTAVLHDRHTTCPPLHQQIYRRGNHQPRLRDGNKWLSKS